MRLGFCFFVGSAVGSPRTLMKSTTVLASVSGSISRQVSFGQSVAGKSISVTGDFDDA